MLYLLNFLSYPASRVFLQFPDSNTVDLPQPLKVEPAKEIAKLRRLTSLKDVDDGKAINQLTRIQRSALWMMTHAD